jgi:hypothetical protein
MNYPEYSGTEHQGPGEYIDTALIAAPDLVTKTVRYLSAYPEPIPAEHLPLCEVLARQAVLDIPGAGDMEANRVAFMKGLQTAYAMVANSLVFEPAQFSDGNLPLELSDEERYMTLKTGAIMYLATSPVAQEYIEECCLKLYPHDEAQALIGIGMLMGLYMADNAGRARQLRAAQQWRSTIISAPGTSTATHAQGVHDSVTLSANESAIFELIAENYDRP